MPVNTQQHNIASAPNKSAVHLLGLAFVKCIAGTEAFVVSRDRTPKDLTDKIENIRKQFSVSKPSLKLYAKTYLRGGSAKARRCIRTRAKSNISRESDWTSFLASFVSSLQQSQGPSISNETTSQVQRMLGYTFQNRELLVDALRPRSLNFEGLEFLGDAALELACGKYWATVHPAMDQCRRNNLKKASLCNKFLAFVAIALGLHEHVDFRGIAESELLEVLPSHNKAIVDWPCWDFWMEIDYPKSVADAMEALFGAVYVDSGFDDKAVAATFESCLRLYIDRYILENTVRMEPVADLEARCPHVQLGVIASSGSEHYTCRATLGGEQIGRGESTQPQIAERIACRVVLERARINPRVFEGLCKCFQ
ncbi:ribonuclease III domain-containing protein [Mortierella sp. GBAus27b]|nr:ribonuclease III domain-containing protein [Mortierella sp. GBAus27b]KAI8349896.1 ribonuclease III domain-containing protein [Mortierella sp. GBAus27b]